MGRKIDDSFVDALSALTLTEAVVVGPRGPIATSAVDTAGHRVFPRFPPEVTRALSSAESFFGPAELEIPSYAGYRLGQRPIGTGQDRFRSYLFVGNMDGDSASPIHVVSFVPRFQIDQGALYSTLGLAATSLVVFALLLFIGWRLVVRFTKPLTALTAAAGRVGRGELSTRVPVDDAEELQALAVAFNEMIERLATARRLEERRARELKARSEELATAYGELKTAHEDLHAAQTKLLEASRLAGMAEVATNVLHNVGNVLNSVNVAAGVLQEVLGNSKVSSLRRIAALVPEDPEERRRFFAEDPRATKVGAMVKLVASAMDEEHERMESELATVKQSIDHIKGIVRSQQRMAAFRGITELASMSAVLDAAVSLHAWGRDDAQIDKQYSEVEPLLVERHRVMQILMNLLSNARHAVESLPPKERRVTLRLFEEAGVVVVEVSDNGVGIDPDALSRVFQHGFTTKADGHGFGLHSAANAASEMGGSLMVESEGRGKGATFRLQLPRRDASEAAA